MTATQAVVSFFYQSVQLPPFLTQYAGFFTGLFTGALSGFALHAYIQRNKCDKAKVKLAIHHVLRVIRRITPKMPCYKTLSCYCRASRLR